MCWQIGVVGTAQGHMPERPLILVAGCCCISGTIGSDLLDRSLLVYVFFYDLNTTWKLMQNGTMPNAK